MKEKSFIITVDTEGDNLWGKGDGDSVSTENTLYIPRFQYLCEKYGFKPVYLTNYEMAMDDRWVRYSSQKAYENKCEIGLHIHAWNSPPIVELAGSYSGLPYITEYPRDVISEKVSAMMSLLQEKYQSKIVSHRSGRWATNDVYFDILAENGIKVDCSYTPGIDMTKICGKSVPCGNDYRRACRYTHILKSGIVEVPMTSRRIHRFCLSPIKSGIKNFLLGEELWLRPVFKSEDKLRLLTEIVQKEPQTDYLEFMIHSSELMPGGSPYFKDEEDIEKEFNLIESYFKYVSEIGYKGRTLSEYIKCID